LKTPNSPTWITELVRTIRETLESTARTVRLAVLLLLLIVAAAAVTWGYQALNRPTQQPVQVIVTVPRR